MNALQETFGHADGGVEQAAGIAAQIENQRRIPCISSCTSAASTSVRVFR